MVELQDKVGLYKSIDTSLFAEKWDEVRAILSEAPSADTMKGYVESIGLDMDAFYRFYGEDVVDNAIRYAKDLKDRYSVLWICYALGVH